MIQSDTMQETLMSLLYDIINHTEYHSCSRTTKQKYRFVPSHEIQKKLKSLGIEWNYQLIRRAYDKLCKKGLCDRMLFIGYVHYSPKEMEGHTIIEDRFVNIAF